MSSDVEGSWWGPDKWAHALFVLAVVPWAYVYGGRDVGIYALLVAVIGGMAWEISNGFKVICGRRGASLLDALAFLVGGVAAGLLLWWAP